MTWKEFKTAMEDLGIKDEDELRLCGLDDIETIDNLNESVDKTSDGVWEIVP